ncbi:MAG TPA: abhydrolase domain-containing 18 [Blastocatellia bacterium]|nr:abhydrolase domain-containing 18 [Blastocatellia bacterium]
MMIPFEWGLEFLADHLGRNNGHGGANGANGDPGHAREIIFDINEQAVAGSDRFFYAPPATDFSFDGEWLRFPSPVITPYENNNTVHARYFPVPARGDAPAASLEAEVDRARRRAVIVLPQWNADAESHVGLCRLLNRAGIAALRLSLPYHDRRTPAGLVRADYMVSANVGRTLQACRQAVLDLRGAIDWLVAAGYDRIGITGTSIGSCIAFLSFVHDGRLRAGAYNHVSSYFGDVVWKGISTAHVRRSLETELTGEEVRRAWLAISPNSYIELLMRNPRHGLFISALYDLSFPPDLSRLLFEECERHGLNYDRSLVPWGHYTMGKTPFKYYLGYLVINYFRKNL